MYIRTCYKLNIELLKNTDTEELFAYRIYVLLKNIDAQGNGSGALSYSDVNKITTKLLNRNYTVKSLSRLPTLRKYMTFDNNKVFLNSWEKLWDYFNVSPTVWVKIPQYAVSSKKDFTAHVYAGFVSGNTISREKIVEILGISVSTQKKYEKMLGIHREYNFLEMTEDEFKNSEHIPTDDQGHVVGVFAHNGMLYRQLPNTYRYRKVTSKSRKQLNYNTRQNEHKNNGRKGCGYGVLFIDERYVSKSGKVELHLNRNTKSMTKIGSTTFSRGSTWIENNYGYNF